jgi:hypothetical protein
MPSEPARLAEVLQCLRLTQTGFFFEFDYLELLDCGVTMPDMIACIEHFGAMTKDATDQQKRDFVLAVPWADITATLNRGALSSPDILIVGTLTALMEASQSIMLANSPSPEEDAAGKE